MSKVRTILFAGVLLVLLVSTVAERANAQVAQQNKVISLRDGLKENASERRRREFEETHGKCQ